MGHASHRIPVKRKVGNREYWSEYLITDHEGEGEEDRLYLTHASTRFGLCIGEGCYWKRPYKGGC